MQNHTLHWTGTLNTGIYSIAENLMPVQAGAHDEKKYREEAKTTHTLP